MKQVIISGNHLLLTEAIKNLTKEKFKKLFRHAPDVIRARVEMAYEENHLDRQSFTAKGILEVNGKDCVASSTTEDLYKSIDEMVRKLDRQLRKRSTKNLRKKRKDDDALAA